MKSTITRRLSAALVGTAFAAGALVATPAQAAEPSPEATAAAEWLADQIDVTLAAPFFEGTALDIFFALDDLGLESAAAQSILDGIESHSESYIGALPTINAGATAKLATAVQNSGGATGDVDGNDLIANLESTVIDTGAETGRAKDVEGEYGEFSNTFSQVWVVQALAQADSALADATTNYLLKQQCADGSFRENLFHVHDPGNEFDAPTADPECGDTTTAGDDQISVDATALGLRALLVADDNDVAGLDDDITSAVSWLKTQQASDGSFSGNSNATGLAGAALDRAGEETASANAAKWLSELQIIPANAGTKLTGEIGGIALDSTGLANAKSDGIIAELEYANPRGEWISATAQSAAALVSLKPASDLTVTRPAGYAKGGTKVVVTVSGLLNGESAAIGSSKKTAGASGTVYLGYTTPKATSTKTVTVIPSGHSGTKSITIKSLGAKTLKPTVKYSSIKRGKKQTVTVKGLAPAEPLNVVYGGKKYPGKASSYGNYSFTFNVGSSKGKKYVKVFGAFSDIRKGSASFTVK